jgi:hypothetical protein
LTSQIPWLKGDAPIDAWLLLISTGRFRLLNEGHVSADPDLESIRALILGERPAQQGEPTSAQPDDLAALPVRLLKSTFRRHGSSWRISVPVMFEVFAPVNSDRNDFVALLTSDGYWEIWYTDALRLAALGPLPAAMRSRK